MVSEFMTKGRGYFRGVSEENIGSLLDLLRSQERAKLEVVDLLAMYLNKKMFSVFNFLGVEMQRPE